MSRPRQYGFSITGGVPAGDKSYHPIARFKCTGCDATIDVPMRSGQGTNGLLPAKLAKDRGWEADAYEKSAARCPNCIAFRKHNDPNSELRKAEIRMATALTPPPTAPATPAPPPTPPATVPLREPTIEQRATIRGMLEKHFDEDEGCYIGEASDATIASVVNVPRMVVERLRETAYGPIRVTSDQLKIRNEIAAARAKITDVSDAAKGLFETINADLAALRKQLADLERRNGVKAA